MAKWSIRLTERQTWVVWHRAKELGKTELAALVYASLYIPMTINLRKLSAEQVEDLKEVLEAVGKPGVFGRKRRDITKRSLRRKLKVVTEFSELSVVDRLAEVGRKRFRRRCQCFPLCHPPCGAPRE